LASPELKAQREAIKKSVDKNRLVPTLEATCTAFRCSRCKQNKTTYYQLQTRRADEGMTTFVKCVNCGHQYIIFSSSSFLYLYHLKMFFNRLTCFVFICSFLDGNLIERSEQIICQLYDEDILLLRKIKQQQVNM
jgi:ribosomal protein S27E